MILAPGGKPSLRSRLMRRVVVPLVVTWALGSGIALAVANYFAGEAFDRALLDDAHAVAAHVRRAQGALELALSPAEMRTLLFDQTESVYYAVFAADGRLIAGQADLRPPPLPEGVPWQYADFDLRGRELRGVSLRRTDPGPFTIVMAQTSASRTQLLHRMLVFSAVPQVLLLMTLVLFLRRVIHRDLQPLAQLQQTVDARSASDLAPVPRSVTAGATTRDVERLGVALNSLLERLARSIEAQREFAGNVAHELRTPLAGIRAQASYALKQESPAVWREQLQGIAQGEQRASHLVDQLLALARADEASAALSMEDVPLHDVVRRVLLRYLAQADAAGIDLGAEGLDEPAHVHADAALIEGILGNLLDNAFRYGRSAQPRVTVSVARDGADTVLCVTDNGPGMSPDEADQLLRRWSQGASGQKLGAGAGLGLAIVQRYAQLMGATFSLLPGPQGAGLSAAVRFSPPPPGQASAG
ncbi:sensor histidine kinase [Caenimonas aquaedulcis]|uniref:histidine kinase n=1 Tax=Caenimonas aquaedulcis TaxID=2793270 RepID=A0A931H5Q6_9BURK|nr:sensor histidine kinase [Caenimonas aquaedulcis]MBG9389038.1 sensor histidine kinase [Caenimonas aquaedulcis]